MNALNKLLKTIVFDNQITLSVLDTTEMVNDAIRIHNLTPLAAAALGRTLTVSTFMSSNLKNEKHKLSITIKAVEKALNGDGRVLIRPSGTESLIRVMIEGINQEEINEMAKSIAEVISEKYGLKN